jgi:hypothetical protein
MLAPALALLGLTLGLGCNNPPPTTPSEGGSEVEKTPPKPKGRTELASTGWGTLKGRVTLDGPAPDAEIKKENEQLQAAIEKNKDYKDYCLSDKAPTSDKQEQSWRIGKNEGVQNVVVFLKPPTGSVFKIDTANPTWDKQVTIEQPFCAFHPHVLTLFPSYYDVKDKAMKPSGQKFEVKNNATIPHNTDWKGDNKNPGSNELVAVGKKLDISLEPSYAQPVHFSCKIHQWMDAYAWVLDHPYAAVTDKDGNYEIKHAPAGVDVQVVAWHEKADYLEGGNKGTTIKLKDGGETTKDFKVKAK